MRNGGNFSVPGSGKTTVAYYVWATERQQDEVDALLVVAPLSAFSAWQEEAVSCFDEEHRPKIHLMPNLVPHDADVVVIGYPRLTQRGLLADLNAWLATRRVMIVFDESHRVKAGETGVWGRAAARLAGRCSRRYVLSGTPMPQGMEDVVAQLDLCWPGRGRQIATGGELEKYFVRTTKDELGLPELATRVERVTLDPDHRRVYDFLAGATEEVLRDPVLSTDVQALGAALMRQIAAATNPAAVLDVGSSLEIPAVVEGMSLDDLIRNSATVLRPAKLVRAAQLVTANAERKRKTLLWSAFVANVGALAELLDAYQPAVITGDTPSDDPAAPVDRARELLRFRTDPACQVLIATPQTLGEGISLHHTCVDQIHVDRVFNAGVFLQSIDRTHRLGMDADCEPTLTVLLAEDTIDSVVHESMDGKIARMSSLLSDASLGRMRLPQTDEMLSLRDVFLDGIGSVVELRDLLVRARGR